MADATEGQVFSIEKNAFIPQTESHTTGTPEVPNPAKVEEPEDEEEEEEKDDAEEKKDTDTEEKDNPDEPSEKEKGKKPEAKKPEEKPKPEAAATPDFTSYLKTEYSEKYGIEKEEDLREILDQTAAMADEIETLRKSPKEPVYRNEQEKKIAEFLKPWPVDKLSEGMLSVASIMQMDVANISDKKAMEEAFILHNTDLTREEAKELFEDEYNEKWNLNKDDFEDQAEYDKKKKILDIKTKNKVAEDRRTLLKKQEELKAPVEEKKAAVEEVKIPEKTISEYNSHIDKFFTGAKPGQEFTGFVFSKDDNPDLNIKINFEKEQIAELKKTLKEHVKSPTSYDKNGKIPNFDAGSLVRGMAKLMYSDYYDEQFFLGATNMAAVMKAEQIAGKKPSKESKAPGQPKGISIVDQFRELGKAESNKKKK